MPQDQRLSLSRLSGAGAAPGDVPVFDGYVYKPGAAGGGAALLGYALVRYNWPTITSDGVNVAPSSITLMTTEGDHGLAVLPTPLRLQMWTDSIDSHYFVSAQLRCGPGANILSTDVHQWQMEDPVVLNTGTWIGSTDLYGASLNGWRNAAPYDQAPSLKVKSTGGTNRTFGSVMAYLGYYRYAPPA